jgi:predicted lipid-binding transport protein (Tim44 family)
MSDEERARGVRHHTIRGALGGLLLGMGATLLLVLHGVIAASSLVVVLGAGTLLGVVVGIAFARLAPPRGVAAPDAPQADDAGG